MNPSVSSWSCLSALSLLLTGLGAPTASARPADAPTLVALAPDAVAGEAAAEDAADGDMGGGELAVMQVKPEPTRDVPRGSSTVSTPDHLKPELRVSAGAWAVYGSLTLVPLGGIYGASRLGGERLWVTTAQTASGMVLGSLPGSLLFVQPPEAGGRWAELDVAVFGVGMVLTPPLAALGTWGLGELAFDGSRDRGRAFVGALGGAATGMLLGVAMHGLMEEVVGNSPALKPLRKYIALGFIGSGATLGYQWAGGGPRVRPR